MTIQVFVDTIARELSTQLSPSKNKDKMCEIWDYIRSVSILIKFFPESVQWLKYYDIKLNDIKFLLKLQSINDCNLYWDSTGFNHEGRLCVIEAIKNANLNTELALKFLFPKDNAWSGYIQELENVYSVKVENPLDSLVHDTLSEQASNINNEGIRAQIHFLRKAGWLINDIEKAIN